MDTVLRAAFPPDDRYWRIEWIGAIHRNPRVPTELQVEVAIVPLISVAIEDHPTSDEALNVERDGRRFIRVGTGLIPSLIVGSVWRHRHPVSIVPYASKDFIVDLSSGSMTLVNILYKLDERRWLVPPHKYVLPREMWASRCAMIETKSGGYTLIIPCLEVLRAWFIRSSAMANQMFSGPLKSARERIYDTKRSGIVDGRWTVMLRTRFGERDAWPAAMLACHAQAFRRAEGLFDSILKQNHKQKPIFLEILPPDCAGHLRARGIDLSTGDDKRFLVFDLLAIPYPTPSAEVIWEIENSNAKSEREKTDSPGWVFRPPSTRDAIEQDFVSHEEEPESAGGLTLEKYSPPAVTTQARLRRMPNQKVNHLASSPSLRGASDNNKHSSSMGTGGGSSSSRLSLVANEQTEHLDSRNALGFEDIGIVRGLLNAYPNTRCDNVSASNVVLRYPDGVRSRFPTLNPNGRINWSFVGEHVRQAVVLEIEHDGLFGYAIEIERRPSLAGEAPSQAYCLGFVSATDQRQLSVDDLKQVLSHCARSKGIWPPRGSGIVGHDSTPFKHTRTPERFAFVLLNELRRRAGRPLITDVIAADCVESSHHVPDAGNAAA